MVEATKKEVAQGELELCTDVEGARNRSTRYEA
jgi:hypothetical protein